MPPASDLDHAGGLFPKSYMDNPKNDYNVLDADTKLRIEDGNVVRRLQQEITSSFIDDLRDARHESLNTPAGNYHRVAAIPVAIVEKWMQEGFNIFDKNVSIPEVLRRLHGDDMQNFIATSKNFR